jgi:hypothetical protein
LDVVRVRRVATTNPSDTASITLGGGPDEGEEGRMTLARSLKGGLRPSRRASEESVASRSVRAAA